MKKDFWKLFISSFNIFGYDELVKKQPKEAMGYFLKLFSFAFLIGLLLFIPGLVRIPAVLDNELAKADKFMIDIEFNSSEDMNFPPNNPFLTITDSNDSTSVVTITNDEFIYRPIPYVKQSYSLEKLKDVKKNKDELIEVIVPVIGLLLPSVLMLAYGFNLIKFFFIAAVLSFFAKMIFVIMKKKVKYKKLVVASFFSLTPMVVVEMVAIPLNLPVYFVPFILYLIWYIVIIFELTEEF